MLKFGRDALLDKAKLGELLVEVSGKQHQAAFELVLMGLERPLSEVADREGGHERNGRDQENAADNEPANRSTTDE